MFTLLPGWNSNEPDLSLFIISSITWLDIPSSVVGRIPGVILPGLLFCYTQSGTGFCHIAAVILFHNKFGVVFAKLSNLP